MLWIKQYYIGPTVICLYYYKQNAWEQSLSMRIKILYIQRSKSPPSPLCHPGKMSKDVPMLTLYRDSTVYEYVTLFINYNFNNESSGHFQSSISTPGKLQDSSRIIFVEFWAHFLLLYAVWVMCSLYMWVDTADPYWSWDYLTGLWDQTNFLSLDPDHSDLRDYIYIIYII